MSGVQPPGSGVPRNPAVGFADVLRQSAPCATLAGSSLRLEDLGTPMVRRDYHDLGPPAPLGQLYGGGLGGFGHQIPSDEMYSRVLGMNLSSSGAGNGMQHLQLMQSGLQRTGGSLTPGLLGTPDAISGHGLLGAPDFSGHGLLGASDLSSPGLSSFGSLSTPSLLTSILGSRGGGHTSSQPVTLAELLRQQAQPDVTLNLGGHVRPAGQLTPGNSASIRLAQLVQQEQQRQQAALSVGLHQVSSGAMLHGAPASGLSSALSQVNAAASESALLDFLRHSTEQVPLDASKLHNSDRMLSQLALSHMGVDHMGVDHVRTMPSGGGSVQGLGLRMSGISLPHQTDFSAFGSSSGLGAGASHAKLASGKMSFSSVLSTGHGGLGDPGEEQLVQVDGQLVPAWLHARSSHAGDPAPGQPGAREEFSALMALAEFAQSGNASSGPSHGSEFLEGGAKGKKGTTPAAQGKRRKQAKVPKLAGPAAVDSMGTQSARHPPHGQHRETPESLQETASVLLAIASGENLPKPQRDAPRAGTPRDGGDDDESLDPQQLLLHLQTHPPAEGDERRGARAQKRRAASSEDESESESKESDDDGTEEQRQRRRKTMSILGKHDRTAGKGLVPKRGKIAKVAKVSGSGGGGLVRVRRSSLFKAISQPGRAIGVKDAVDKDKGPKDAVGGGVKDALSPSPPAAPLSSAASKRPAKEPKEAKGEARSKKLHVDPPGPGSAPGGGGSSKRRDGRDPDAAVDIAVIIKLARALTDLADRIPYMGVHTSTPKVWSDFNDTLANVTTVAGIRKQWLWLTRQIKPDLLLSKWREQRHDAWTRVVEECDDPDEMHALISEFSTDGIDWVLVSKRFRAEQTQNGFKAVNRQARVGKQEPGAGKERAASKESKDHRDSGAAAKSAKPPSAAGGAGGGSTGGEAGKARASDRNKDKEKDKNKDKDKDASRDVRVSPAGSAGSSKSSFPDSRSGRSVGREGATTGASAVKLAGAGGKGSAEDSVGGNLEVRRAWRYRKGRWMFVVVKDDVKKDERKKETPPPDADIDDVEALSAKHAQSGGQASVGEGADAEVGESVNKKVRRRVRGRLTMPKKRAKKAGDGGAGAKGGRGLKGGEDAARERGAGDRKGNGDEGDEDEAIGASASHAAIKREPGDDGQEVDELLDEEGARKDGSLKPLQKWLHRLVRRIHYAAFTCPERDVWRNFHRLVDKCVTVRELSEKLVWVSQHMLQKVMKSKWKARHKQWVRDCRNSTCTADFKLRCREFRLHVDWDEVDATLNQGAHAGGSGAGSQGSRPRASGAGVQDADALSDGDGRKGKERLVRRESGADGAIGGGGSDAGAEGAGALRASQQRAEKGIVEMRRMVNRLVRRIHYSAFSCQSKETWKSYHQTVDRSATASEVAERLMWASRQLLPGMLRAAWLSRREQWEDRCLACSDKNALRLLKFELEKYAISWEAVEASTRKQAAALLQQSSGLKDDANGGVRAGLNVARPAGMQAKDKDKKSKTHGSSKKSMPQPDEAEAGKGRAERYKRRRSGAPDGDAGGRMGGDGPSGGEAARRDLEEGTDDVAQRVLEYRPESADFALSAGGRESRAVAQGP